MRLRSLLQCSVWICFSFHSDWLESRQLVGNSPGLPFPCQWHGILIGLTGLGWLRLFLVIGWKWCPRYKHSSPLVIHMDLVEKNQNQKTFSSMWLSDFSSSFCTLILIPWWLYVLVVTVALASSLKFHLSFIFTNRNLTIRKNSLWLVSFPPLNFCFMSFCSVVYIAYYIWCVCAHLLARLLMCIDNLLTMLLRLSAWFKCSTV